MKRSIVIGPLGAYFSNRNAILQLPLHSHYCEVTLTYAALGDVGFPVFKDSMNALVQEIRLFLKPAFDGDTNEAVASKLFSHLRVWSLPRSLGAVGQYELQRLEFAVRCTEDEIGHADTFARYVTEA